MMDTVQQLRITGALVLALGDVFFYGDDGGHFSLSPHGIVVRNEGIVTVYAPLVHYGTTVSYSCDPSMEYGKVTI